MFNTNLVLRCKNLCGNKFEYVANKRKLINDGLSNPKQYIKEQFQRIFKNNEYEIFEDVWESTPIPGY